MSRQYIGSPSFAIEPFAWPSARAFYAAWLRLGALALLWPDAWSRHELLGWLPFWLVGVPALALLQQWLLSPRTHSGSRDGRASGCCAEAVRAAPARALRRP